MKVSENAAVLPRLYTVLSVSDDQYALLISAEIWAHNQQVTQRAGMRNSYVNGGIMRDLHTENKRCQLAPTFSFLLRTQVKSTFH